jgi:hypothetical protein
MNMEYTQECSAMMKHTPGPWHNIHNCQSWSILGPDRLGRDGVTSSPVAVIVKSSPEAKANARLIAAAPELLEALTRAIEHSGYLISGPTHPDVAEDEGEPRWLAHARAAIAKATAE